MRQAAAKAAGPEISGRSFANPRARRPPTLSVGGVATKKMR